MDDDDSNDDDDDETHRAQNLTHFFDYFLAAAVSWHVKWVAV